MSLNTALPADLKANQSILNTSLPGMIDQTPSSDIMELQGSLRLAQLEIERLRRKLVVDENSPDANGVFEDMPDLN